MKIYDTHVHSNHSEDSDTPPEMMIRSAIQSGIAGICFTDHWDPGDPDVTSNLDFDAYVAEILSLRARYADRIDIILGIEVGVQPHMISHINSCLGSYEFDYVIASLHCVSNVSVGICPGRLFESAENLAAPCGDSLRQALQCLRELDRYDAYGHADYILRYLPGGPGLDARGNQCDFFTLGLEHELDELLGELISRGKALEINTSGYRYGLNRHHPGSRILDRYRQLGGRVVSLGSDAHMPSHLGYRFQEAALCIQQYGFTIDDSVFSRGMR
ncbi:MAG: hypothetical protein CVV64_11760 [Candidatus Wallbacteria bacterium HGW-Wallbacteria-1]|uniref:Histidinol-phosphatase n=1 Tax=Candidatus Wallbacteria bacterium HGW-Wallbacteria-1 TaxID=2013854 RepID=A0A2N1PNS1_9BACT|nr:MAG: hypothetical protein CVV64_11760 [Candidatus Wallbacteria bacterium HGW-Wallbacteria-1]